MVHGRSRFSRALRSPLYLFSINVSFLLVFFSRQRAQPLYSMGPIHACVQGGACAVWRVTVRLRDRVSQGHAARQNPKKKICGAKNVPKKPAAAARRRAAAPLPLLHPATPPTPRPPPHTPTPTHTQQSQPYSRLRRRLHRPCLHRRRRLARRRRRAVLEPAAPLGRSHRSSSSSGLRLRLLVGLLLVVLLLLLPEREPNLLRVGVRVRVRVRVRARVGLGLGLGLGFGW